MSSHVERTKRALLQLGLEDWIPIPEALSTPEIREAVGEDDPTEAVSKALAALVADGHLRLYRGRWDSDPAPVAVSEGLKLLDEQRWYRFHTDDPNEERLYFVNADNIRDDGR